jgi:hypothetical protein
MNTWFRNHPVVLALASAALGAAATTALINYCLNSWLILPLI